VRWTPVDRYAPRLTKWFAWYPVTCTDTGKTHWLERVYRVKWFDVDWGGGYWSKKHYSLSDRVVAQRWLEVVQD